MRKPELTQDEMPRVRIHARFSFPNPRPSKGLERGIGRNPSHRACPITLLRANPNSHSPNS